MLPVPIKPDDLFKPLLEAEAVAGLNRAPQPQVMGQLEDLGAGLGGGPRGAVPRAVVDYRDPRARQYLLDGLDDASYRPFLVVCRNDDKQRGSRIVWGGS